MDSFSSSVSLLETAKLSDAKMTHCLIAAVVTVVTVVPLGDNERSEEAWDGGGGGSGITQKNWRDMLHHWARTEDAGALLCRI